MPFPIIMAVAAAVGSAAAVYGTVKGVEASKDAAKAQEEMAEAQRKQQQLAAARSRRQAIREAQIARARAMTSAYGTGVGQTSGSQGGIGSIGSQLGSNLGYASQQTALSQSIYSSSKDYASAVQTGQRAQAIGQIGGTAASYGFKGLDSYATQNPNTQFSSVYRSWRP